MALLQRVAFGSVIGAGLGIASYFVQRKQPSLPDVGVETQYVSQDPQLVDALSDLAEFAPCARSSYRNLISISDAIVQLYLELFANDTQRSQYILTNQVKVQQMMRVVEQELTVFREAAQAQKPELADICQEQCDAYHALMDAYLDNIFTDSVDMMPGNAKLETIFENFG